MTDSIRSLLKHLGCTDRVLSFLFESNFDRLIKAIQQSDIKKIIHYHKDKHINFASYSPITGNNALHAAILTGDMEIINYIIQNIKNIDIEDKNFEGDSIFMLATMKNNLELIKTLIEKYPEINPNTQENWGTTPFIVSACQGNLEIARYLLLELHINYKIVNYDGQSAVHRAAFYGNLQILKLIRDETDLSFSSRDNKGNTPAHLAAINFNICCLRYIIQQSKKRKNLLFYENSKGETPISILVNLLNKVKESKIAEVTPEDVLQYIKNKTNFPKIKKEEQEIRASLKMNSLYVEPSDPLIKIKSGKHLHINTGRRDSQISSMQKSIDSSFNIDPREKNKEEDPEIKNALIRNRRNKKLSSNTSLKKPPKENNKGSSPSSMSPLRKLLNKVISPYKDRKKEPITFQESIKNMNNSENSDFPKQSRDNLEIVNEEGGLAKESLAEFGENFSKNESAMQMIMLMKKKDNKNNHSFIIDVPKDSPYYASYEKKKRKKAL